MFKDWVEIASDVAFSGDYLYRAIREVEWANIQSTGTFLIREDMNFEETVGPMVRGFQHQEGYAGIIVRFRVAGPYFRYAGMQAPRVECVLPHYVEPEILVSREGEAEQWVSLKDYFATHLSLRPRERDPDARTPPQASQAGALVLTGTVTTDSRVRGLTARGRKPSSSSPDEAFRKLVKDGIRSMDDISLAMKVLSTVYAHDFVPVMDAIRTRRIEFALEGAEPASFSGPSIVVTPGTTLSQFLLTLLVFVPKDDIARLFDSTPEPGRKRESLATPLTPRRGPVKIFEIGFRGTEAGFEVTHGMGTGVGAVVSSLEEGEAADRSPDAILIERARGGEADQPQTMGKEFFLVGKYDIRAGAVSSVRVEAKEREAYRPDLFVIKLRETEGARFQPLSVKGQHARLVLDHLGAVILVDRPVSSGGGEGSPSGAPESGSPPSGPAPAPRGPSSTSSPLRDRVTQLALTRGLKKAAAVAGRLSDTALAALADRDRLNKVLDKTGYAWAKGGLGPWGRQIAPTDLLLLGLAALARSDQEVAAVLQKLSPYPDKAIGAATSPTQAVLPTLFPAARSLPVIPIGR